jgi:hypothetical protein
MTLTDQTFLDKLEQLVESDPERFLQPYIMLHIARNLELGLARVADALIAVSDSLDNIASEMPVSPATED